MLVLNLVRPNLFRLNTGITTPGAEMTFIKCTQVDINNTHMSISYEIFQSL